MKPSGIGGQAVMEGVMMKNKETYAVAVRKPDNEIIVDVQTYGDSQKLKALRKIPFVRGIFNFWDSLYLGTKVLTYSTEFLEEEEEDKPSDKAQKPDEAVREKKEISMADMEEGGLKDKILMGITVCISLLLSIAIFFCVPFFVTELVRKHVTDSDWIIALVEGVLRLALFLLYVVLISMLEDIQRFFMYHGAEHKCINCIENGWELNIENARKASRQHKRCGTSFLLIVMVISIVFLFFIRADNRWIRLLIRLALIPVIAGVSYEFIRLAGKSENKIVCILSKPGLWLQKLTTREPEDEMLQVAIASVEAVFDWKAFLQDRELQDIEEQAKQSGGQTDMEGKTQQADRRPNAEGPSYSVGRKEAGGADGQ